MLKKRALLYDLSPILQLIFFLAVIVVSMLITLLLGVLVGLPFYGTELLESLKGGANITDPVQIDILKYFQIVNQIGVFIIPTLLFAYLVNRNMGSYLSLNRPPRVFSILGGIAMIMMVLPFLHFLSDINEMVKFPHFLGGIEDWLVDSEERAGELTEAFINVKTTPAFLLNLLMIAILPAVGEELLFRGVLLKLFREMFKNVHIAVILSAVLFSALHLQFYGFIPRFFLGILLGYVFVWSGSLWLPIIIHFFNNALAVVVIYYMNASGQDTNIEEIGSSSNVFVILFSAMLVALLMIFIYSYEKRKQPLQ